MSVIVVSGHDIYISHARLSLRHCYYVNGRLLSISGSSVDCKVRRSLPLNGPTDSDICHRIIPLIPDSNRSNRLRSLGAIISKPSDPREWFPLIRSTWFSCKFIVLSSKVMKFTLHLLLLQSFHVSVLCTFCTFSLSLDLRFRKMKIGEFRK